MELIIIGFIVVALMIILVGVFTFKRRDPMSMLNNFDVTSMLKHTKDIVDSNEELLKELSTKSANISKDAIEIKARAVKSGFTTGEMFCKHCGTSIDSDSKFCKSCGKEL